MKLFLCAAIVALCTYIGRLFAKRVLQRYEYFINFQSDMQQITEKIVSLNMPLYNALATSSRTQLKELFWECARSLKDTPSLSFEKLWEKKVTQNIKSFLSKEDVSIIVGAGAAIEMLCKNPSKQQAELYNTRLSKYIDTVEKDKQKKAKLFTTAGVLTGLLIALLII